MCKYSLVGSCRNYIYKLNTSFV